MSTEIKWVPLHPLPGVVYAEMVKEVLEKYGIPCVLKKDFFTNADLTWLANTGAGLETVILVPEDCAKEAAGILHDMMDHI
jgi:hypothetical protein